MSKPTTVNIAKRYNTGSCTRYPLPKSAINPRAAKNSPATDYSGWYNAVDRFNDVVHRCYASRCALHYDKSEILVRAGRGTKERNQRHGPTGVDARVSGGEAGERESTGLPYRSRFEKSEMTSVCSWRPLLSGMVTRAGQLRVHGYCIRSKYDISKTSVYGRWYTYRVSGRLSSSRMVDVRCASISGATVPVPRSL